MSNQKSIVKNSIFNVANTLLNIFLPLITSVYTSRILMPAGIGTLAYTGAIVSLFTSFASLGIPNYGTKIISLTADKPAEFKKAYSELFILNAISSVTVSVFFVLFVILNENDNKTRLLFFALGLQVFFNCVNIDWFFGGIERYDFVAIRSFAIKCISVAAIFLFVKTKEDLLEYALISGISSAINIATGFFLTKVDLTFRNLNLKQHIKPIVILSVTLIFSSIYSRIDIIMLKHMVGESCVGIYNNAHKIVNTIISACTAVIAVFLPRISYLYKNSKNEFDTLVSQGLEFLYFVTIPACTGLMVISKDLVRILYGKEFSDSANAMLVLSLLIVIQGIGSLPSYQMVICSGKESIFIPTTFISALINITLNYILIPKYYAVGAAIASVTAELFLNVFLFIYTHHMVGFNAKPITFAKCLLSNCLMLVSILTLKHIPGNDTLMTIITIIVGAFVYIIANILLKNEVTKSFLNKLRKVSVE